MRVGNGYDLHRLSPGRPLVIGGVTVPAPFGEVGHSDGDVLIHALIDALLGAAALGDIGGRFPPGDPAWAGIDSRLLLTRTRTLLVDAGWRILNCDTTVVLERPKLKEFIPEMRARLAEDLRIASECVSVKAKTNEGVDAVGQGAAVAAWATVLIEAEP